MNNSMIKYKFLQLWQQIKKIEEAKSKQEKNDKMLCSIY